MLPEARQLVRDTEEHDDDPDGRAVAFYGPQSFRDKLPVLPEADPAGHPATTFTGVPYWLIHHLRHPKYWARLATPAATRVLAVGESADVPVDVVNTSGRLDLTPLLRLRQATVEGYAVRATLDGIDVTAALAGAGLTLQAAGLHGSGQDSTCAFAQSAWS